MLKKIISFVETSQLPTDIANFKVHAFTEEQSKKDHLVIAFGNLESKKPILARIHSQCITGESFFSMRCDCHLNKLQKMVQEQFFIFNKREEELDYQIKLEPINYKMKEWIPLKQIIN